MPQVIELPDLNLSQEEIKMIHSESMLKHGNVSLGKAAEIAGYSERTFVELLLKKGIAPISFDSDKLEKDIRNA